MCCLQGERMSLTFSEEKVSTKRMRSVITLISLAALASFPQEKLKTMLPAGRKMSLTFSREKVPARRIF